MAHAYQLIVAEGEGLRLIKFLALNDHTKSHNFRKVDFIIFLSIKNIF